jgi:pilus assembly protein CpaE
MPAITQTPINLTHAPDILSAGVLSIAIISPNDEWRTSTKKALVECQSGPIREFVTYPPSLNELARVLGQNFDIVLIDLDSDADYALDLVETICVRDLAAVIACSAQTNPDLLLRCMRAGAREYLPIPFYAGELSEALVRAATLRFAARPTQKTNGKMLIFLGAKGGSGVTTLACNFALSLAVESRQRTLLIDLNLPLGDVAISLGLKPKHSIVNAFQQPHRMDTHFLATLVEEHCSGLSVLAAPSDLGRTYVSTAAIDKLLDVASQAYDYVVVDAGSRLDLQLKHLFNDAATIYLVTQIGIPELRNSHRLISQLSVEGSPKLEIILNRYDRRNEEIADEHVNKALTRPAQWKIPNNYAAVSKMQNTETLLTKSDSQISRAIRQMSRAACGLAPLAEKEKKKGFSLFGS